MAKYSFDELRQIIKTLRSENGCPWDKEQTHESLKPCMMEEAAEVAASIRIYKETGDDTNLCEELGDVLLQVFLHSQIAEEENRFTIDDVIDGISEKMIRRHPHVFGDTNVKNSLQVIERWEDIKKKEKEKQTWLTSPLRDIPIELPALTRTQKVLKKADEVYHISQDLKETIDNIRQKLDELEVQNIQGDESDARRIGGLLLDCVNLAKLSKIHSEEALVDNLEQLISSIEGKN
ncbi:nucleoside triphosphate pyrophosphohydrolase [Candidatus Galacturonibacter soehngenii]|uniref:Nucleoside triphosphate pyrophosphohydrolase n=1 Tax=Candidatus Galacturonatibacter soehngenii TaxID=2307010 RepID=A0A7V7UB25_9FIRM|nr:nucleoside triphosphate pyrophosphohydrolase [Candidatus Galacturonibacter soehngenii]KAB1435877.1 nucleoside triphosphate pyrophosphohydrolase [Candidatus Galacturonibacter soehngenii]MBA4686621.1 nucleoside triphosphate pyrophosphohydrolase [Candidatus Galacturonibacter soehngenii]